MKKIGGIEDRDNRPELVLIRSGVKGAVVLARKSVSTLWCQKKKGFC